MLQPDPAARPESVETLVERWPAKTMLAAQPTTTGKTPDETAWARGLLGTNRKRPWSALAAGSWRGARFSGNKC
ncbi:hypothetical protein [Chromatium okenii]|nr:hypothetical protein [Chromatium okenii]